MNKYVLFISILFFSFGQLNSQPTCIDDPVFDCADAFVGVNYPIEGNLGAGQFGGYFPGCPANSLDNPFWYSIEVIEFGLLTVTITPEGCQGLNGGRGMQSGLYADCDPNGQPLGVQCNCTEGIMTHSALVNPGIYYVVVDGCAGDDCGFSIDVMGQVKTHQNNFIGQGSINAIPADPCIGEIIEVRLDETNLDLPYDTEYRWSVPTGSIIVSAPPYCSTIQVLSGRESGDITLTLSAPSVDTTISFTTSITVPVFTGYEYGQYCVGDTPGYFHLGTLTRYPAGTWTIPMFTARGCDSLLTLEVYAYEPTFFFETDTVCIGNTFNSQVLGPIQINGNLDTVIVLQRRNYNGCDSTMSVNITAIDPLLDVVYELTDCSQNNSPLNLIAQIPSGNFNTTYSWTTSDGNITSDPNQATISVDQSGRYLVVGTTLVNGMICEDEIEVDIDETHFEPVDVIINSITDVSCFGNNDGVVEVMPVSGTAPFKYEWLNNSGTDGVLTGLPSGMGNVTVTAANGCQEVFNYSVNSPDEMIVDLLKEDACDGDDGSLIAIVSGGTPGYSFYWSDGNAGDRITALPGGIYSVTVTDANGCTTETSETVENAISFDILPTPLSCNDTASGALAVVNIVGSANPVFEWNTGATTSSISNLPVGGYSVTVTDPLTGCSQHQTITLDAEGICNVTISGFVYADNVNKDCMIDSSSTPIRSALVELEGSGLWLFTDVNGYYEFNLPIGNYRLKVNARMGQTVLCDDTIVVDATQGGAVYDGNNFFFATMGRNDLALKVSKGIARPGREQSVRVCVMNQGDSTASGSMTFNYDQELEFIRAFPSLSTIDVNTRVITFDFTNLLPGRIKVYNITLKPFTTTTAGTRLTYEITADLIGGDDQPNNNEWICTREVRASYDPNEKKVSPAGVGPDGLITKATNILSYELQFQNTGNDTAFDVVLRDLIDPTLKIRSILPGPSSHPYNACINDGEELEFIFNNIYLPDSNVNLLGSQGFVFFDVELEESLPIGTRIENSCNIYFDYNAPILTNTTVNTLYRPQILINQEVELCYGETYEGIPYTSSTLLSDTIPTLYTDTIITTLIAVSPLLETNQVASICQGDAYFFCGTNYTQSGTYSVVLSASNGCDSLCNLDLSVQPVYDQTETVNLCYGGSFEGVTYTADATINKDLQTVNGCDSTVTIELLVFDQIVEEVDAEICSGESYVLNGVNYTQSGNYSVVFTANGGCDSTVNLNLQVAPVYDQTEAINLCYGDTFDGVVYTSDATITKDLQTINGCDSTVTIELAVFDQIVEEVAAEICSGESYVLNGVNYTQSGNYSAIFTANGGCDSTVNLNLHVAPVYDQTETVSLCYGGSFEGVVYTADATINKDLQTTNGCDSTVTIELAVFDQIVEEVDAEICSGESYVLNGVSYTQSGNYSAIFTANGGCDSTVNLNLQLAPVYDQTETVSLCYGGSFEGLIYTADATINKDLQTVNGCDSTVTIELMVFDQIVEEVDAEICSGESYVLNGVSYTQSGNYSAIFTANGGCDSTVNLNLQLAPVYDETETVHLCYGGSFEGVTYTADATINKDLQTINGCDSTVTIELMVFDQIVEEVDAEICSGESYVLNGVSYTQSGNYSIVFTGNGGCDSTVNLNLQVAPVYDQTETVNLCYGGSFEGLVYTADATINKDLQTANGCDSTVTYQLMVADAIVQDVEARICEGESYLFNGINYDQAGEYAAILMATGGCDSTVNLNLAVDPVYENEVNIGLCFGGTFDGVVYNADAQVSKSLQTQAGCDSLVTYHIRVSAQIEQDVEVHICDGESYNFDGVNYFEAGNYTATFSASGGCDSTVNLSLQVDPVYQLIEPLTLCYGASFDGIPYTEDATVTRALLSTNGCDSIMTYEIDVLEEVSELLEATICANESYLFDGNTYSESGLYTATFIAQNGCDSTVNLELEVNPVYAETEAIGLCYGGTFDGTVYTANAEVSKTFSSAQGCDSTVTYQITVGDQIDINLQAFICENDSFQLGTTIYSQSGQYQEVFKAAGDCDSIVNLDLTVYPIYETRNEVSICSGELLDGELYFEDTVLVNQYISEVGCDSTEWLDVRVLPSYESEEIVTLQAGELYQGQSYSRDTSFQLTFTAANGCDSIVNVVIDILTSSTDLDDAGVQMDVFPNPTSGALQIRLRGSNHPIHQIQLIDWQGRLLHSLETTIPTEQFFPFDLGDIPSGMYILKVNTSEGFISRRVIKMK